MKELKNNTGFTLIELVTVLVIISLLLLAGVFQFVRMIERGRQGIAFNTIDNIRRLEDMYFIQHDLYTDTIGGSGEKFIEDTFWRYTAVISPDPSKPAYAIYAGRKGEYGYPPLYNIVYTFNPRTYSGNVSIRGW